jgi:hypothetical protein
MIASFEVWLWKGMAEEARAVSDRTDETGLRRKLLRMAIDYNALADASRPHGSDEPTE